MTPTDLELQFTNDWSFAAGNDMEPRSENGREYQYCGIAKFSDKETSSSHEAKFYVTLKLDKEGTVGRWNDDLQAHIPQEDEEHRCPALQDAQVAESLADSIRNGLIDPVVEPCKTNVTLDQLVRDAQTMYFHTYHDFALELQNAEIDTIVVDHRKSADAKGVSYDATVKLALKIYNPNTDTMMSRLPVTIDTDLTEDGQFKEFRVRLNAKPEDRFFCGNVYNHEMLEEMLEEPVLRAFNDGRSTIQPAEMIAEAQRSYAHQMNRQVNEERAWHYSFDPQRLGDRESASNAIDQFLQMSGLNDDEALSLMTNANDFDVDLQTLGRQLDKPAGRTFGECLKEAVKAECLERLNGEIQALTGVKNACHLDEASYDGSTWGYELASDEKQSEVETALKTNPDKLKTVRFTTMGVLAEKIDLASICSQETMVHIANEHRKAAKIGM